MKIGLALAAGAALVAIGCGDKKKSARAKPAAFDAAPAEAPGDSGVPAGPIPDATHQLIVGASTREAVVACATP